MSLRGAFSSDDTAPALRALAVQVSNLLFVAIQPMTQEIASGGRTPPSHTVLTVGVRNDMCEEVPP